MKMKMSAAAIASMLAVFFSGAMLGALGHRLYTANTVTAAPAPKRESPEEWRKRFTAEMQSRLHLKQDQVEKLSGILDATRDEFRAAREENKEKMKSIQVAQVEKVKSMLDESQKPEYEKMLEEREKRMKEREKQQGAPPRP